MSQRYSSTTEDDNISDTFNVRYRYQGKRKEDLGRGAEASVYGALYRDNAVAIKEFRIVTPESKVNEEIGFMKKVRGEYHVVQFIGKFVNPESKVCIVMEVAYNLTLGELLRRTVVADLPRELRVRLAREVCLGVRALHHRGIAHEDIKTDNVLLNFGLRAKVCDFGAAKFVSDTEDYPALSGTKGKKAPEKETARGGSGYDRLCSDIFSLGLLLKEVLHGLESEFSALLSQCTSSEPRERPSCDQILAALSNNDVVSVVPYSRLVDVGHTLNHLDEAEKFNICYYWTDFDPDEDADLTKGRALFFKGLYSEAFDYFSKVDCEELPVADVFLGIMKFHGLGPCEENLSAARDHFEKANDNEDLEANGLVKAVIYYYLAMALMSLDTYGDNERARVFLQYLDIQGNSFGPSLIARMHFRNLAAIDKDSRKRFIIRHLFKAVKAGHAAAEAYLTFFYIDLNKSHTIPAIPAMEMEYLHRSVEGGSALGRLLLDFVNNTIDEDELLGTNNPEIFTFLGSLYHNTGQTPLARRWFSEASLSSAGVDGAAMMAVTFEDEGNSEKALEWLLKAKEYSEIHNIQSLEQSPVTVEVAAGDVQQQQQHSTYHSEDLQFSPQPGWQLRLAEKYLNEDRLPEARGLVAQVVTPSHTKTWYDFMSLRAFALKSDSARSLVKEARDSLPESFIFFLAFVFQQSGLRDEAVEWLEECIRRGSPVEAAEAWNTLGCIFYEEKDFHNARSCFEVAADKGSVIALDNLGYTELEYFMNFDKALIHLEKAAAQNYPPAMAHLADLLVTIDKPQHLERAKELHIRCSQFGYDNHLWSLVGLLGSEGVDSGAQELLELDYWMDRALRNVEFAVMAELGIAFESTSTGEIVNKAAERGTGAALYSKGIWHGLTEPEEDYDTAYRLYFSTAAEKMLHTDSMSWCYNYCEEQGDHDGVAKWTNLMEQCGHRALLAQLLSTKP